MAAVDVVSDLLPRTLLVLEWEDAAVDVLGLPQALLEFESVFPVAETTSGIN